jgi:23S rRNA (uracil1939-C5)-methyltransferase
VHTAQAAALLDVVRHMLALEPQQRLLDAYSGVGTFALPLAGSVREVLAIEEHPQAVQDGERSARLNDVANVRFLAAPVERALPDHAEPFDAAILDPPRRGCHPAALEALARLAPPRIAYVSCHPAVLARDMRQLLDAGYTLQSVQPVDMFPQTPHIECVALLVRE